MFDRLLIVCDGNICRSPTAAALLHSKTGKHTESAGIVGLEGQEMDATARAVALAHGLECPAHVARKLTRDMCRAADLILVMEQRQKDRISQLAPEASGKVMRLGHWLDQDIVDPYKRSREVYEHAWRLMDEAVASWVPRLK